MTKLRLQSPAKINLYLAVTGRRPDAFHNLVSLVAPVTWGDELDVEAAPAGFTLVCDSAEVPADASNLVLRAAAAFAGATGWAGGATFALRKRIPLGAGLGGASSNATTALLGLNTLAGSPLDREGLLAAAASVGSDCALFLSRVPVVMRGRGERIEPLPKEAYGRFRGMRVLIFKPAFAISTPWAYARLAAEAPRAYVTAAGAEARVAAWIAKAGAPVDDLLYNTMERPAFSKFAALPLLLERIRARFGVAPRMSGSGSACYVLLHEDVEAAPIEAMVRESWGPSAFCVETRIA